VLVNGGLNLSELDGWWAEAYTPEVGWAIGDGREHGDDPSWDASEAETLYGLLEKEVVPEFYGRDGSGIPRRWAARMRASMAQLTPTFSANRVVRQYTDERYLPAASAYRQRAANRGSLGAELAAWRSDLAKRWPGLRFGSATVQRQGAQHVFQVQVFFGDLNPDAVRVELYANALKDKDIDKDAAPVKQPMNRGERIDGAAGGFTYTAAIAANRPAADYTPRLVGQHANALVPLESPFILWHEALSWR
jgi:starch phosphorylase